MNPVSDLASRYASKAEIYARYRWDYSQQSIDTIFSLTGLTAAAVIADIGSGTGMLSRHFVERVGRVYAVEPEKEMRLVAGRDLESFPSFVSVAGFADGTTLPDRAVDLVAVGRAIHWFPPQSTRKEFLRILKPGGWLAVLQVPCTDQDLVTAVKSIRKKANGWDPRWDKDRREFTPVSFYYGGSNFQELHFPVAVRETWSEFLGRLSSFSAAPDDWDARYPNYEHAARQIFERFSVGGILEVPIATVLNLGQIDPDDSG